MNYGYGMLVLILVAIAIGVVILVIDFIGEKFFNLYEEVDEEEDDGIYYQEI